MYELKESCTEKLKSLMRLEVLIISVLQVSKNFTIVDCRRREVREQFSVVEHDREIFQDTKLCLVSQTKY